MKTKDKILSECVNQKCFPDIDSPLDNLENVPQHQIKKAMDEYAEEYAKEMLTWVRHHSLLYAMPIDECVRSFKESLKK